ncbi:MAG: HIT family protein [Thermoleophilia bacterium]|nr:HIT family protein [Thermoleophilia bacterium]
MSECQFCDRIADGDDVYATTEFAAAFPDCHPVSDGHTLVVPKRHVSRAEDLERAEWAGLFDLVREVTGELAALPGVEGVNVGINSGEAAGQTIGHAHVHVIPRRPGDVEDPRGGIRWVIPGKADYWTGAGGSDGR